MRRQRADVCGGEARGLSREGCKVGSISRIAVSLSMCLCNNFPGWMPVCSTSVQLR